MNGGGNVTPELAARALFVMACPWFGPVAVCRQEASE